jgi:hypothetical protein
MQKRETVKLRKRVPTVRVSPHMFRAMKCFVRKTKSRDARILLEHLQPARTSKRPRQGALSR